MVVTMPTSCTVVAPNVRLGSPFPSGSRVRGVAPLWSRHSLCIVLDLSPPTARRADFLHQLTKLTDREKAMTMDMKHFAQVAHSSLDEKEKTEARLKRQTFDYKVMPVTPLYTNEAPPALTRMSHVDLHVSRVMFHVSCGMCHVSCGMCHMACVMCE